MLNTRSKRADQPPQATAPAALGFGGAGGWLLSGVVVVQPPTGVPGGVARTQEAIGRYAFRNGQTARV